MNIPLLMYEEYPVSQPQSLAAHQKLTYEVCGEGVKHALSFKCWPKPQSSNIPKQTRFYGD